MRGRFLRLVVIPLLAALAVSVGAYSYLSSLESRKKPDRQVTVVVAARALPPRTVLARDMLSTKALPPEFVDSSFITSIEEAAGKTITVPLAQGEIVYKSKLATKDQKTALAYHIPSGSRAVTVAVNEVSGVAGLVEPGDHVDLILTVSKEMAGRDLARLAIEDVAVLAVVQSMEVRETPGRELKGYTSLTVCVKPEQAVLIAFGEVNGLFKAVLRPAGDSVAKGQVDVTGESLR